MMERGSYTELRKIKKEIAKLKKRLNELRTRRVELEKQMRKEETEHGA
jgi:cell division protein FtsB